MQRSLETAFPGRYEIAHAATLGEARAALAGHNFDAVLLDLGLPDSQGMHSVDAIHAAAPALPLVAMTGLDDEELAAEAIRRGAQDYLLKGQVDAALVARSIRHAIERTRTESGSASFPKRRRSMPAPPRPPTWPRASSWPV